MSHRAAVADALLLASKIDHHYRRSPVEVHMLLAPKMRLLSVALTLSVMLGAGFRASADEVRVEGQTPFYSRSEFPTEHGYFRTDDGHYYHYDKDRDGWHHGRSHREGARLDKRRGHDQK